MVKLPILHFNDVYRVTPQKIQGYKDTIDVTQFAALVDDLRDKWDVRESGDRDGLVLFSGDVFSPSVESTVTRGSHMVPVMNQIHPDVSLLGNHDFDFGYPHLTKLITDTRFPWLLSNIIDTTTSRVPEHVEEFKVVERCGVRVGVIGLVEKEWIGTVSAWPREFVYKDMAETAIHLSQTLRDPNGEYRCDLIIALTHARIPNDVALAKVIGAFPPSKAASNVNTHGADIILGGHDHLYYISKGVSSWDHYDTTKDVLGAEQDYGDVLVVKSGCDFRDLSEFTLDLLDAPAGSVRRKYINSCSGVRHQITPDLRSSKELQNILEKLLSSVSKSMKAVVCRTTAAIDVRSQLIRTEESAAGNWFADIIRHSYDEALCMKGLGGADGTFICAGTLRGDSVYGPGNVTLGDILEILPFDDPVVVLELDGQAIWDAMESALSTWPAQEGRFPVISGFRIEWDSRRPPGERVLDIWLQSVPEDSDGDSMHSSASSSSVAITDLEPIERTRGGKKYKIVTREYMAEGHDGFLALQGQKYLIDDENGQLMSNLVRKYLLGATFIKRMCKLQMSPDAHLHCDTSTILARERAKAAKHARAGTLSHAVSGLWKTAAHEIIRRSRSKAHYRNPMNISIREHMTDVDCFDGAQARVTGKESNARPMDSNEEDEAADVVVVHPIVDGRLKNIGRE